MPDNAALTPAVRVALLDAFKKRFNNSDLLIPGNLLMRPVEQHIAPREPHKAFGTAEGYKQLVERRGEAAILHQAGVALDVGREIGSNSFGFDIVEGPINNFSGEAVGVFAFLPYTPKLPGRTNRAVLRIMGIRRHQELRAVEERRHALPGFLIADLLADALVGRHVRGFDLDYAQGQPVDEKR